MIRRIESPGAHVQALVYIFIALASVGIAGAAYFGFTFTPIEAFVAALVFGAIAVMLVERTLRQRSEARLEKAVEDLSRLLSTDAQAGSVLSQRVNALADENAGRRLETLEADVSVLGTVVRQVAEAMADLEEQRSKKAVAAVTPAPEHDPDSFPEPVIPLEMLRQAITENRLVCHIEPIVRLPARKPWGYAIVPRLMLEDGELADPPDFMPRRGGRDLVRRIEELASVEAIVIARRAKTSGSPIVLLVPFSRALLGDDGAVEQLITSLDANRVIAPNLAFTMPQAEFRQLTSDEKESIRQIHRRGARFVLVGATTLRIDFGELEGLGFSAIELNAGRFIDQPQTFADFHSGDVAAYGRRYNIEIIGAAVITEQQVLSLYEDGITLARGPHIGSTGPVRPDLMLERPAPAAASRLSAGA
jgi:cyclic-di-GMP phosphodiesterase TipF (flagellum assembly factor)